MKNVYGGEKRGIIIERLMIMFCLLTHVIMRTYTYITITVDGTLLLRQFGSEVLGEPGSPAYAYSLQLYGSDVCSLTRYGAAAKISKTLSAPLTISTRRASLPDQSVPYKGTQKSHVTIASAE